MNVNDIRKREKVSINRVANYINGSGKENKGKKTNVIKKD